MAQFEKVSYEAFRKDVLEIFGKRFPESKIREAYDGITVPRRADVGSAGYDFASPFKFTLSPFHRRVRIPTGIKLKAPVHDVLFVLPRSGRGCSTGYSLTNTVGVIDSSYYGNQKNEGDIIVCLSYGHRKMRCDVGDRFVQGILIKIDVAETPTETAQLSRKKRKGGFGSSGK